MALLYDARMKSVRRQSGYLLEVQIIVAVVAIFLVLVVPMLPPLGRKLAAVVAALVFIAGAYYDLVTPGWRPGTRLHPPWNWVVFALVAALITLTAGAYVVS
jgi:hypothetical protein